MMPDLQASLLCDDVRQERNGKFILIGLFDGIGMPAFPAVFQRICIVNRWCCGEGQFKEKTRIMDPQNARPIAEGRDIIVQLPNNEATATNVEFFINVTFPVQGVYWIEILLDGHMRLRYPLRAGIVKPPPAQEMGTGPAPA